jgi:hypothetical protein
MGKINDRLPAMYRKMHSEHAFVGDSWRRYADALCNFITGCTKPTTVLDYGCGPAGGFAKQPAVGKYSVIPYDPYVAEFADDPWGKDWNVFFSCDVFEHIPQEEVRVLVRRLCKRTQLTHIFIGLSTRAANKCLPNGLNAHLTVKSADWWHGFLDGILGGVFDSVAATSLIGDGEAYYAFERRK